ncbi:MAG: hypothetical protein ACFFD4_16420 [Candidatus Odinarchaeota archaeon]
MTEGPVMDEITSFYWINKGGIPRFRKIFKTNSAENKDEGTDDLLLSGFLTALMSFSSHFFEGEQLSHIELLNHKFFFSLFQDGDILMLCTGTGFSEKRAYKILEVVRNSLNDSPIPMTLSISPVDESLVLPLLLGAIDRSIPRSISDIMKIISDDPRLNKQYLASLVMSTSGEVLSKQIGENIPFELQTFLESFFWEKIVHFHYEQKPIIEKLFDLGTVNQSTIQTEFGTVLSYHTGLGIISLAFGSNTSEQAVKGCSDEITRKIREIA